MPKDEDMPRVDVAFLKKVVQGQHQPRLLVLGQEQRSACLLGGAKVIYRHDRVAFGHVVHTSQYNL
jgi:hypothetical protein